MSKPILAVLVAAAAGIAAAQAPAPAARPAQVQSTDAAKVVPQQRPPTVPSLPRTASPAGAKVYFVSPADGATLKSPVKIVFGLSGMGVAPAGVQFENAGHHHLIVDAELPAELGQPLPATDNIRHFGKGQTEASIDLKPGKHTLQLVLGDHMHIPFAPVVASQKITITVAP